MHERNMLVPFPTKEMEQPYASLERLLVDMGKNRMPDYRSLPFFISSTNTEACANWYNALTLKDPGYYERGDIAHVKIPTGKIIYSKNPTFGHDECDFNASKNKKIFDTTLNIHSHKNNMAFSGYRSGDLATLIRGWGKDRDHINLKAMIVSCTDFNYLMFKTDKTKESCEWEMNSMISGDLEPDEFLHRFGNIKKTSRDFRNAEKEFYNASFDDFYNSYKVSFLVAEVFRMGFYFSKKDGNYIRLTKRGLRDHIGLQLKNALEKSKI